MVIDRAVVLGYNLPGVTDLVLTRDVIVAMYNGSLTHWNDWRIQQVNADVTLPHARVHVCARADKSGARRKQQTVIRSCCL